MVMEYINTFIVESLLTTSPYFFLPIVLVLYRCYYIYIHNILAYNNKYSLLHTDRQYYIIFNISKASMLMFISYLICIGYNRNIIELTQIDWSRQTILKNITGLYAITDIVPLFVNRKKMMMSTVIHHICVIIAVCGILQSNLENIGLSNAIIVYGLFSSIAFLVNGYLGIRFMITNTELLRYIKKVTFLNYIISCSINWSIQSLYLMLFIRKKGIIYMNQQSYYNIDTYSILYLCLYISFLYFWISDDIILMRFLLK